MPQHQTDTQQSSAAREATLPSRRTWIPVLVLAVGLLSTAVAATYVAFSVRTKERIRFESASQRTRDAIRNRLETYIALLRGAQGLFAASEEVTLREFRVYIDHLQLRTRYPGIQGIGYSRRIPPDRTEEVTASLREQGHGDFEIWPGGQRPEYHSIVYLEPLDWRNRRAIGYDMFSEPVRRLAMERARDTGRAAATGRVTLVQETDEHPQAGFLIYLPIYQGGIVPDGIEERRSNLAGFVYSPFRADDLLSGLFGNEPAPSVSFRVFDERPEKDRLLHDSRAAAGTSGPSSSSELQAALKIDIAGREWVLVTATPSGSEVAAPREQLIATLAIGTGLSLLMYGATAWLAKARAAAERVAADLRQIELMRARRTRHLALHADVSMAMASSQGSAREVLQQCAAAAVQHLQVPLARVWILDSACHVLELAASAGLEPPPGSGLTRIAMGESEVGRVARQRETAVVDALPLEPALVDAEWARANGIARFAGFPMMAADRLVGVLALFSTQELPEDTIDALQTTAELLAQGIERARAEEALRDSEERFRAAFNQAAVGMALMDPNGRYIQVNQRFCDIVEYTAEELAGLTWRKLTHHEDIEDSETLHARVLSGELPNTSLEKRYICKGGRIAWVSVSMSLVRDAWGAACHTINVIRDITARKRAEQTVSEQKQELEDFVSIVAHDLKHPVVSVQGLLGILRKQAADLLDEDNRENLELALSECIRMKDIISQLGQIARIGSAEIHVAPVDIRKLLARVVQRFAHTIESKRVAVSIDCPDAVSCFSRLQVEEALDNLVDNALQHGCVGPEPRISLRCIVQDSTVQIAVADNGPGIDPRFHHRIFEIFRRLDPSGPVQGSGVGLTAAQRLIRRVGGTISLESEPNQGATFTIRFPAQPSEGSR